MLNEQDIKQLEEKGISKEEFLHQIDRFRSGFPPLDLDRPATDGDGIRKFGEQNIHDLAEGYDAVHTDFRVLKFVPASGAATRMFKDVFAWRDLLVAGVETEGLLDDKPEAASFFGRMRDFAWWDDLKVAMDKDDLDADHMLDTKNYLPLLEYLLFDAGLDYAALPKALINFHRYDRQARTAMEEHLAEGAAYASDIHNKVPLHFTLSPEHISGFKAKLEKVQKYYENAFGVSYDVSYSVQKPSTDTIAVGLDNLPFRENDGSLLFRPGGHGALIENLNDLDHDIIFIKNIDNVVPDRLKEPTILYKKAIGGILLNLKKEINAWMDRMDKSSLTGDEYLKAVDFATNELKIDRKVFPLDPIEGSSILRSKLNRPLRVCGMVKNEGEPGGGPFWVKDPSEDSSSLQIVELSQVDMDNPEQAALVKQATHFNPVDLVCSFKDYKGNRFDLRKFIDKSTGFISRKSKDGKELKALERPGLWNGAMAYWNTVFVEVPLITFNPVKTINDLLRDEHQ